MKIKWIDNDYSSNGIHGISSLPELSLIVTFGSSKMWIGEIIHENNKIKVAPIKHHDLDEVKRLLENRFEQVLRTIVDDINRFINE